MPRKELSAPSENRKKAVRLFDGDDRQNDDFEQITDYGCDETDDAIEYLRSFGYINDLRLAQNTALRLAKGLSGKKKIFAYLASKGIKSDVISQIDFEEVDFKENCKTLALKHVAMGKTYEQIAAALMRAGFSSNEIYYAMGAVES